MCRKSKVLYCSMHGYEFIEYKFENLNPYGPTWGRVFGIREHLRDYDWIFYLDTDTVITNPKFSAEVLLEGCHNIVVGRMPDFDTGILNHISTSAMLLRNCDWTMGFLELWLSKKEFIDEPYHALEEHKNLSTLGAGGLFFEQSAFHFLYDTNEDVRSKVLLTEGLNDRESTYKEGSFLMHFARSPKEQRIKNFMNKRAVKLWLM